MSPTSASRGLWLAGGALILVVVMVVVALTRNPVELDPTTPEGIVQQYLQAIADRDYDEAISLISAKSKSGCEPVDIAYARPNEPFVATLGESRVTGRSAFVDVTISLGSSPGPFDPGMSGFEEVFALEQVDSSWLIVGSPWPYFDWRCETA